MMGAPERIALIKEGLAALDGPALDAATAKLQRTRGTVPATNLDPGQVPASHPCCFPAKLGSPTSYTLSKFASAWRASLCVPKLLICLRAASLQANS